MVCSAKFVKMVKLLAFAEVQDLYNGNAKVG